MVAVRGARNSHCFPRSHKRQSRISETAICELWDNGTLPPGNVVRLANQEREDAMSLRVMVGLGILIGSTVGGYVPMLWGAEMISFSSLFGSLIGGLLGIWAAYKLDQRYI